MHLNICIDLFEGQCYNGSTHAGLIVGVLVLKHSNTWLYRIVIFA